MMGTHAEDDNGEIVYIFTCMMKQRVNNDLFVRMQQDTHQTPDTIQASLRVWHTISLSLQYST